MKISPKFTASFFLFAAIPVLLFLLFGFHGMDVADRGFIPALAYRILSGEVIYHDFFYVRPPLSPYLHTFEMALFPESMEIMAYRFFFYVFMWLPIYWSIRSLERYFDIEKMGVSPWLLGSIGYLLSVHNFFAAPWHTVDGIFFSALGFYLITRESHNLRNALGVFCFILAALAKQPFGIVPFVGVGLLGYLQGWKKGLVGAVGALAITGVCVAVVELALTPGYNFTREMMQQTAGVSSLNEMRWGGYQLYIRPAAIALGIGLAAWLPIKYILKLDRPGWPMAILGLVGFAAMAAGPLWFTSQRGAFSQPIDGFYHGLVFLGGAIAGISIWKGDRQGNALLLAMTAVGWASGVSWGYAAPVLYCFPAVFALAYFLSHVAEFRAPRWYWPAILVLMMGGAIGLNRYPYQDALRPAITHDMGAVFPKLNGIQAGDEQFANYDQLRQLHLRYGDNFAVLPSMPLAHYVTNTIAPIPVDWAHDAEINYQVGIDKLIASLVAKRTYVFALRSELGRAEEDGHFRCSTLRFVLDHWSRIDSTSQFYVYAPTNE